VNQTHVESYPSRAVLYVKDIVKSYGGRRVVDHITFYVEKGEIVGLLGHNGAGKTTAFYITMGLIAPEEGQVFLHGESITNQPVYIRARNGIGYLAQEPSIFADLTVEENLLCVLEGLDLAKEQRQERLFNGLKELHLEHLAKQKASSLSGGERRRLEIARALAMSPDVLLLDEPFANIDPLSIQDVKNLIVMLAGRGIAVLITDHNAREILSVVSRAYLVSDGKVLLSGPVAQLVSHPVARQSYLGENFSL
jgi:lipopolysaccharide export system ATP-binding protein